MKNANNVVQMPIFSIKKNRLFKVNYNIVLFDKGFNSSLLFFFAL